MLPIEEQPYTEALKNQIDKGFARHAIASIGYDERSKPHAFVSRDGNILAGVVTVAKFWGALHVSRVFVEEAYRGQGLATRLLERALAYGVENHCLFAFVETMSFQALEFYKKRGFYVEFTRSGYSHGTSFHYLKKEL